MEYCSTNPCAHGSCKNNVLGYSCVCQPGYEGTKCDQALTTTHAAITTGAMPLLPLGPYGQLSTTTVSGAGPLLPFGPHGKRSRKGRYFL
ncbi:vitamin K-dependent protein Z-like [Mytilus galloprovincialis]|uniref:vitamin K-dependent protein Z-like n=1 Tax=Mytilus galloprovincialis TaxID=29158 RepID=UPI003F7C5868